MSRGCCSFLASVALAQKNSLIDPWGRKQRAASKAGTKEPLEQKRCFFLFDDARSRVLGGEGNEKRAFFLFSLVSFFSLLKYRESITKDVL